MHLLCNASSTAPVNISHCKHCSSSDLQRGPCKSSGLSTAPLVIPEGGSGIHLHVLTVSVYCRLDNMLWGGARAEVWIQRGQEPTQGLLSASVQQCMASVQLSQAAAGRTPRSSECNIFASPSSIACTSAQLPAQILTTTAAV